MMKSFPKMCKNSQCGWGKLNEGALHKYNAPVAKWYGQFVPARNLALIG